MLLEPRCGKFIFQNQDGLAAADRLKDAVITEEEPAVDMSGNTGKGKRKPKAKKG